MSLTPSPTLPYPPTPTSWPWPSSDTYAARDTNSGVTG
ncbi:hypothetical protein T4D_3309 [Trichinella pseudospiralis]|uniref:Uncharacterized protein n=1 Tax=Trichinella pseudospiralis TaxID=6337 RepID=A0A0V1DLC9_TRIPS|nr:hypothetical protein T4D_3309 [Trichinella pseudospiralis]